LPRKKKSNSSQLKKGKKEQETGKRGDHGIRQWGRFSRLKKEKAAVQGVERRGYGSEEKTVVLEERIIPFVSGG